MSDVLIIEPFTIGQDMSKPFFTVSAGTGAANLVSDDPRELFICGAPGNATLIDINLGVDTLFDTIYLGNTDAKAGDTWGLSYGTSAAATVTTTQFFTDPIRLASEGLAAARGPALFRFAVPIARRYIRLTLFRPAGVGAVPLQVGNLVVGNALRTTHGREIGEVRTGFDAGVRTRLEDGGLTTVEAPFIEGFKWTFGDLSDAELKTLLGIRKRRKTTRPILVIEDGEAVVTESLHYCTFIELEAYNRLDPRKTRWALTVEDWLGS